MFDLSQNRFNIIGHCGWLKPLSTIEITLGEIL